MATANKQPHKHKRTDNSQNDAQSETSYDLKHSVSHDDVAELLSRRFIGLNVFFIIMLLLAVVILWAGLKTATQIQDYRQDYKSLQQLKQDYRKLQVEHQRLLIEQQTFSATPQIASRAVAELNMHFPAFRDKMIVQPQAIVKNEQIIIYNTVNSTSHTENDGKKDAGGNE